MPTPTEVADALYTVLLKNSKGEFPSDEAYQSMMEYAFGHIHLIRQMPEKQRITCLWHLVELGGIPLMIHTLQPGEKAFSMGMTLMGIMFRDENLLSHKMGRLVLKNPRFLPAIERGLTPETDEMMPFLVAQVLHNILRSAAGTQIKDVAKHGKIVKLLRDLTVRSIEEAAKSDWRLVFVTIDILMLMEVANAHDELKDQDIMGLFMDTFAHDDFVSMMKEHGTLLQRVLGVYLLWLVRTRHNKDTEDVELRRAIFAKLPEFKECIPEEELAVKDAEKLSHAERTAASLGNVYRSIEGLSREEETTALAIHLTLKSRVRNWDQVEKEAEGKVRSPDFKKQFEEQKLEVKQAGQQTEEGGEPPQRLVISDDESDDDDSDADNSAGKDQNASEQKAHDTTATTTKQPPSQTGTPSDDATAVPDDVQTKVAQLKNQGNTFFRAKMYDDAIELYTTALEEYEPYQSDANVKVEAAKLLGNRAECHLRREEYPQVLKDATSALDLDPNFIKAYYRRAKAHQGLKDLEAAIKDMRAFLEVDPTNKSALALMTELKSSQ